MIIHWLAKSSSLSFCRSCPEVVKLFSCSTQLNMKFQLLTHTHTHKKNTGNEKVSCFNPSSKIFYWPFHGDTSFVDLLCFCSVLCLLCLCVRLFICALWSPAGKGLTSWLLFVVSNCKFITFPLVSWVRCGTWLYRFQIFAPLLTLSLSDVVFIMLINVKMPTIVCILTFMSRINFVLSWVERRKSFITSGPVWSWSCCCNTDTHKTQLAQQPSFASLRFHQRLTLEAPIMTATGDKLCDISPNSWKIKAWYFMKIVCWQTILMKYHALFVIFEKAAKFEIVVCCKL